MAFETESIDSEKEDALSSTGTYNIIAYPADYTLEVLNNSWQNDEIVIPRFQRKFVWNIRQASRLIESFLMGLPVPPIFLYREAEEEKHIVVDGHQRLQSIFSFFRGQLPDNRPFKLEGVYERWEGKAYVNLEDVDARRLRSSVLRAIILRQLDPDDTTSVYHVFERLNTGGTSLTPQEVRNCVYHGPLNDFVISKNESAEWRLLLGSPRPDKRMRDIELIVRFFALTEDYQHYTKPMKEYISDFMKLHRMSPVEDELEALFDTTVAAVVANLGEKPFHIRRRLNAAVFDSVMVAFALADGDIPTDVRRRYEEDLLANGEYNDFCTSHTTDKDVVTGRIGLARQILFG